MKTRLGMLAVLIFLTSCGSSSASSSTTGSAGSRAPCGPDSAVTLASDPVARVYSLRSVVYGCSVAHGRTFRLGHATRSIAEGRAGPMALAGSVVAYGLTHFGVDTVSAQVVVRRLTDGAVLHELPATSIVAVESLQSVGSIVVKADGAVAWISSERSILGHRGGTQVRAASGSANSLLASGTRIDPTSLRLRGSTLSWRDGGVTRHATLR